MLIVKRATDANYAVIYQGSKITGKPLSNSELEALRKKHTKVTKNARTGEKTEDPDYNEILREKFMKTVTAWDFKDATGAEVPCNDDTKLEVFEYNTQQALDILNLFDAVTGEDVAEKVKN